MRVVIALGGNAIAPGRGGSPNAERRRVRVAAAAIADIARAHDVIVTHGSSPQVGFLALRSESEPPTKSEPLDVLGAESEGWLGYLIERELASIFPGSEVATLLTQVEVDPKDPAFDVPAKPIGPVLSTGQAHHLARCAGWRFLDDGDGLRRVVASPEPRRIRELRAIEACVDAGVLVVCAGGGGIPVIASEEGLLGVEAVIDKDRTAALLADQLHADVLLLLTDVPAVYEDWPEPRAHPLRSASVDTLRKLTLPAVSMGAKVEAACRFALAGGDARIGSLDDARRILCGRAGTRVQGGDSETTYWPREGGVSGP